MSEDNKEPWRELCEQASKKQDPEELMRLTKERSSASRNPSHGKGRRAMIWEERATADLEVAAVTRTDRV
jgi:hypothetical protein